MSRKTDMLTLDIIVVTNTIQVLLVASDAAKCWLLWPLGIALVVARDAVIVARDAPRRVLR